MTHESIQLVFRIEGKIYLIEGNCVRQILPKKVHQTNIGEPYTDLIRLNFVFADESDDEYGECIDFDPRDEIELRQIIAVDCTVPKVEKMQMKSGNI